MFQFNQPLHDTIYLFIRNLISASLIFSFFIHFRTIRAEDGSVEVSDYCDSFLDASHVIEVQKKSYRKLYRHK